MSESKDGDSKKEVVMYGADWCGDCRRAKSTLDRLGVKYTYHHVDDEDDGDKWRDEGVRLSGSRRIPAVVYPDGTVVNEPSNSAVESKCRELGLVAK